LKRKYESLVGRRGKKKALVAVGHKIIVAAYHIMKDKEAYKEPQPNDSPRKKNKQVKNYLNKLKALGIEVNVDFEKEGRLFTEQIESSSMKLT
jgi:predicted RNA-binding protein Jag